MHTLPLPAQLILQEMRHYLLIARLEQLQLRELDTDAYMLSLAAPVAQLLGLPPHLPDAWVNTYMLYISDAGRYSISDTASLELLALQCHETLEVLAKGLERHKTQDKGT